MREDFTIIVVIVKQVIENYEKKLEQLQIINNSSVEVYKNEINKLKEDIINIVDIDLEVFNKVFKESGMDDGELNKSLEYIRTIKILLENNINNSTTFKLFDSQKKYIELFFDKVNKIEENNKKILEDNKLEIDNINIKLNKYKELLKMINDNNSKVFIEDIDTINSLFDECDIDSYTKRKVLLSLIKYNKEVFDRLLLEDNMRPKLDKLDINEVIDLFKSFGYDFMVLSDKDRENILYYADLSNMEDIFTCLRDYNFPMFNLKTSGKKLALILINCDKDTFKDIVDYSKTKGILPSDLVGLIPALIKQTNYTSNNGKGPGGDRGDSPIIGGKSDDYKKNIKFLEKLGFRIDYIFSKCREILIMKHERLKNNYRKFVEYGFSFNSNINGELTHPAFTCFLTGDFERVVDQFIESGELGYKYIKNNMSRITTVSSPHALIFYNIYASYMDRDEFGEELIPEGPFVNPNSKKLMLRGEITRYSGSGYENKEYRGLNEDNKKEKTMTIDFDFINKELFDKAVEDYYESGDTILVNLTYNDDNLESIEKYTDVNCPYRYNFDGILISKIKVLIIYNVLKNKKLDTYDNSLLYAIELKPELYPKSRCI